MPETEISFFIRRARPGDLEMIVEYNRRIAAETEDTELDLAILRPGVAAALADESKCLYFVAESADGRIIGQTMITFEWSDWRNGFVWWIQSVYVAAEWRRRGVFTALYAAVETQCRTAGGAGIRLYAVETNDAALATYERLGLHRTPYRLLEKMFAETS